MSTNDDRTTPMERAAAQNAREVNRSVRAQPTVAELSARGKPNPYTGSDLDGLGRPTLKHVQHHIPRRFTHCVVCGNAKLETRISRDIATENAPGHTGPSQRDHAICKPCYEKNGTVEKDFFQRLARDADRESPQWSVRNDPAWEQIQARYTMSRFEHETERAIEDMTAHLTPFIRTDAELQKMAGRSLSLDDYFAGVNSEKEDYILDTNDLQHLSEGSTQERSGRLADLPEIQGAPERVLGMVKWYDMNDGVGMITPTDGGRDVFVHDSAIIGNGVKDLEPGKQVGFERVHTEMGPVAEGVHYESRDLVTALERASAVAMDRPNFAANGPAHAEALHRDAQFERDRQLAHRLAYDRTKHIDNPLVREALQQKILDHWNQNPGKAGMNALDEKNPLAGIVVKEKSPNFVYTGPSGQDEGVDFFSKKNHMVERTNEWARERGIELPDHNPDREIGAPLQEKMLFERLAGEKDLESRFNNPAHRFGIFETALTAYADTPTVSLVPDYGPGEYLVHRSVEVGAFDVHETGENGRFIGTIHDLTESGIALADAPAPVFDGIAGENERYAIRIARDDNPDGYQELRATMTGIEPGPGATDLRERQEVLRDVAGKFDPSLTDQTVSSHAIAPREIGLTEGKENVAHALTLLNERTGLEKSLRGTLERIDNLRRSYEVLDTSEKFVIANARDFNQKIDEALHAPDRFRKDFDQLDPAGKGEMLKTMRENPQAFGERHPVRDEQALTRAVRSGQDYLNATHHHDTHTRQAAQVVGHEGPMTTTDVRGALIETGKQYQVERQQIQQKLEAVPKITKAEAAKQFQQLSPAQQKSLRLEKPDLVKSLENHMRLEPKSLGGPAR